MICWTIWNISRIRSFVEKVSLGLRSIIWLKNIHECIGTWANDWECYSGRIYTITKILVLSIFRLQFWYKLIQICVDVDTWSMFKGFVVHMFRDFSIHTFIFLRYGVFNREVFHRNALVDVANTGHWFARDWTIFLLVRFPSIQMSSIDYRLEIVMLM